MHTFQVSLKEMQEGMITIAGDDAHHISKVLRLNPGETIRLTDGQGSQCEGVIEITGKMVSVRATSTIITAPKPLPIHLFISLIKPDKLELIVQKAVELNISSVQLIATKRCQTQELGTGKWERIQKITNEAFKQCGRAHPLVINNSLPLVEAIKKLPVQSHFFFNETEEALSLQKIMKKVKPQAPYGLWIGPEGGWDPEEKKWATDHGFYSLTLGDLVLRAETAALHAISTTIALGLFDK